MELTRVKMELEKVPLGSDRPPEEMETLTKLVDATTGLKKAETGLKKAETGLKKAEIVLKKEERKSIIAETGLKKTEIVLKKAETKSIMAETELKKAETKSIIAETELIRAKTEFHKVQLGSDHPSDSQLPEIYRKPEPVSNKQDYTQNYNDVLMNQKMPLETNVHQLDAADLLKLPPKGSKVNSSDPENSEPATKCRGECGYMEKRSAKDYELVQCLDKGGFGVVFEVKHKIDKCDYAVKIIKINGTGAKINKVLREVEVLAKLDHPGCVRYYTAWFENLPSDWIDDTDSECSSSSYKKINILNSTCDKNDEATSSISDNRQTAFQPSKLAQNEESSDSVLFEGSCNVRSSDEAQESQYLYIQMQLCRKKTLKDWLWANTLNRDQRAVSVFFGQIVKAVDYLHGCGHIHRDLKPSNIFFSMDGAIKIGDFGLVTSLEKQNDSIIPSTEDQDIKHTADVGTELYMSPEQISRNSYNQKVDIFAMGMILFELFYPFSTEMERNKTLLNLKKGIFPETKIEMPNELIKWLLELNPEKRPSTTKILDSDLMKELAQSDDKSTTKNSDVEELSIQDIKSQQTEVAKQGSVVTQVLMQTQKTEYNDKGTM